MTDGQRVRSFMGPSDENVLKVDSGHDCTTLNILGIVSNIYMFQRVDVVMCGLN